MEVLYPLSSPTQLTSSSACPKEVAIGDRAIIRAIWMQGEALEGDDIHQNFRRFWPPPTTVGPTVSEFSYSLSSLSAFDRPPLLISHL
ncbi:hypothetical protein PanWU01x14_075880, partial [Parasponia andersonii]